MIMILVVRSPLPRSRRRRQKLEKQEELHSKKKVGFRSRFSELKESRNDFFSSHFLLFQKKQRELLLLFLTGKKLRNCTLIKR